ncbi:succinate--CoA ligase subunit alpha [Candidatus Sumerlaeota bacterium]|nr:succinate--CoA ligase subunit alpha [Candidatus Sumerlaeota bacterium]
MSILIDEKTRVIVQGITGRDGSFHALSMREYGTKVVGGVVPGKGGSEVEGIPVFNSVNEAKDKTGAQATVLFVPARFASSAMKEAIEAKLEIVVCITEGIPVLDMIRIQESLEGRETRLIGPNCPGIISPGKSKLGIMPGAIHKPGGVGVISRSGTLTYEVVYELTRSGMGQSTCIGIGGDPVVGTGFIDLLQLFQEDSETQGVVLIGEIGGTQEEETAEFIREYFTKPVVAFIAGRTAPSGKRMGHAGAIISGNLGTAEAKIKAFGEVGVPVASSPGEIPGLMKNLLAS